jgi:phosphoribosylglycinamide formyltransferase-1
VHFVRAAMDDGPIIVQAAVPVLAGDDEAELAARVLAAEHRCYPLALKLAAEKRLRVENECCLIDGAAAQQAVLIHPPPILG